MEIKTFIILTLTLSLFLDKSLLACFTWFNKLHEENTIGWKLYQKRFWSLDVDCFSLTFERKKMKNWSKYLLLICLCGVMVYYRGYHVLELLDWQLSTNCNLYSVSEETIAKINFTTVPPTACKKGNVQSWLAEDY